MKFVLVVGARPNFMKIAPILDGFRARAVGSRDFVVTLVHTGQHYDHAMSDAFFADLNIREPDINLGVGSGSHAEQTARVMIAFERVCLSERPDWVVVVGDVNSTLACSITARKLGIHVAHVEAGLRSRDMSMPEEINRLCTDAVADLLFTTDEIASENLRREGIAEENIAFVGNTMIDSLLRHHRRARDLPLPDGLRDRDYAVVTLHRPSNVDSVETLSPLFEAIRNIAERIPVVFPIHPRTRRNLETFGLVQGFNADSGIRFLAPLGYLRFIGLVSRSKFVLTDSGGIQEEATVLGVPCLTMRDNTERPITCSLGTNILVGTHPECIRRTAFSMLSGDRRPATIPPKWDGKAGERIVEALLYRCAAQSYFAAAV
jgi:UDP-N-acetylglucosamine 2-epimerase (non-hydrolysing)